MSWPYCRRVDLVQAVSSPWWEKSHPALLLCPWLSSSATLWGQWAVLVEKGRLCKYLGCLCTQSSVAGLCSCPEYYLFFCRDLWKRGLAQLALPFLPRSMSLAVPLLRSGVWSLSPPHCWKASVITSCKIYSMWVLNIASSGAIFTEQSLDNVSCQ